MTSEHSSPDTSMAGKTCLITGATDGIGFVTARELARMGADVILVGRNSPKCAAKANQIREETLNQSVEYVVADLSSQHDVRNLAEVVKERKQALHVLVNNAGALMLSRQMSPNGIEMTFALNHLAYFQLTHLLADLLASTPFARVINVSSSAHKNARIELDDIQDPKRYIGFRAYSRSKLCNVLFTYELARRLRDTTVTANVLHPGLVATNFLTNNGMLGRIANIFLGIRGISVEQGARTPVYLASSREVEGVSGQYYEKCRPVRSSKRSYDEDAARRLWEISAELTGLPVELPLGACAVG